MSLAVQKQTSVDIHMQYRFKVRLVVLALLRKYTFPRRVADHISCIILLISGKGRHFCGGSLIAPNVVLSVAHCHQPMIEVKAVIGRHDLRNTNVGEEIVVKKQIPHPQYDETSTDFDYMIMILERDATEVTDFVKVSSEFVGEDIAVTTMGYGDTYSPHDIKYPAPTLQEAEVFTYTNEDCDATTGTLGGTESHGWMVGGVDGSYEGMISDQMICASDVGKDSCYGDSGKSAFVLFHHVNACVQYDVLVIYSLCLNLACLYLIAFTNHIY